jgi:hypothetical protein
MSSSSTTEPTTKTEILSVAKQGIQLIYRTNFLPEPSEDGYTPPPLTGPQRRIDRLHNFPRLGFTRDISAIAMLGGGDTSITSSSASSLGGGGLDSLNWMDKVTNDTTLASIEYIPPTYQTTGLTYNKKDAQDYIRGIAAVAIMIICLYIIWGLSLLLLRMGRVDCCFRLWCCKKKKSGTTNDKSRCEGGEVSAHDSARAVDEYSDDDEEDDEEEEEDDEMNQDCCCITCRESIRAKGGCCTRNVFCGWLSGKPPKVPTKASLMREQEMKNKRLIKDSIKAVGGGIESVNKTVKGVVVAGSSKLTKSGGTNNVDDGGEEDVVGTAEMAVAAVASEEVDENNKVTEAEEAIAITKKNGNDTTTDIIITDEYLQKRQKASRRTMLAIRIIFLASAALVIIFSIKLCVDGYRGINDIFDSVDRSIGFITEHIESVKKEVDDYIVTNEEMARRKAEWINRTKSQIQAGFDEKPWCPLALMNDGKIEVNLSLAKLLLRGNLFKLALIDKVDEVKDQALDVLGGAVDTVQQQSQVGGVGGNVSIAEGVSNVVGGANKRNVFTDVTEPVQNTVDSAEQTTQNAIDTVTGAVNSAVQTAENAINTVTGDVTSAVQTTENAISTVTGDLAYKACMSAEECQKRSDELGLKFSGSGEFESHGCFSVQGELTYWGEGTLDQIVSPNVNGQGSTLHERVVCKAATAVAVNLVDNAVDNAVGAAKEKVFTVVTFLDNLQNPEGGKVEGILNKVLGLKGLIGENNVNGTTDADGDKRIKMLVARLTKLVRSLIVSDIAQDIIPGGGQRALELQASNAVDAITETIVEKDGINYTILSLADNFTGDDLIINGYNVTKLFTTNLTIEIDVASLTQSINEKLEDSSSFLLDIFRRLQTALESVLQQARGAQDSLESILPYFNVAVVFAVILILLTSFFIIGTILAWVNQQPRLFRCTQDRIILPIFILVGLFVWIFTTVFLTLGVLAGDYCVISPDVQMNKILEQTLANLSPIGYKFAYFYFNGCQTEFRPILMSVAYKALIGLRIGLDQFFELVNNLGEGPLRRACGLGSETDVLEGDPVNALSILVNVLRNHVGGAMNAALEVGKLTLCKSFYPMYAFLAHQILCTDFINLLGPMFADMFIISIFSMLMVTMRVAWHELVEDEVSGEEGDKLVEDGFGSDEAAVEAMDAGEAGNEEVVEAEEAEPAGEENVETKDAESGNSAVDDGAEEKGN